MNKVNNKYLFVLAFILVFSGLISATTEVCGVLNLPQVGDCTPQTYNSCYLCLNTDMDDSTGLSDYITQLSGDAHYYTPLTNTVCGNGGYYVDSTTGFLKIKTPSLPFTGNYTFRFYYGLGSPNDIGTESFTLKCGGKTYNFPDNDDSQTENTFRFAEVQCAFNSGYNYVEIKSTDMGSVFFKKIKITGELTCPPPTPYCGDYVCNGLENCSTCPHDCGACPPPTPYCGDGICNGLENCNTCSQDCGACPPPTPYCGDGICNNGETCLNCSCDCGICPPPTPYCGDNICNNGETCLNCSCDCGICPPIEPVCGNHIKEAGEECDDGNLINGDGCSCTCEKEEEDEDDECDSCKKTVVFDICEPIWKCSGWSECSDGLMTRQCIDENHCDVEYNKPYEKTACSSLSPVKVEEDKSFNWIIWIIIGILFLIILIAILIKLLI